MTKTPVHASDFFLAILSLLLAGNCFAATTFTAGIQTGSIQNSSLTEASGIAVSRMNANVLWAHNDSGDSARIFPMTSAGTNLGTYTLSGVPMPTDWEDIAVGPGPNAGTQYLYLGDIGDNSAAHSSVSVLRVPEPAVSDTQSATNASLTGTKRYTFTYPGGARDAESLFVDPVTSDIYIISKRENPHHLYRATYSPGTDSYGALAQMTGFTTTFSGDNWLTAADISPNGNEIIVRGDDVDTGLMFLRPPGGSITDAFNAAPISIPLHSEGQGEAIGFDPNGRGYFTTSEGSSQPIYYFNRLAPPAGQMYWDNNGIAAGSYVATGAGMGGTGTWNTTALKWYTGGAEVPWSNGNDAVFCGTAGTVTLASGQNVHSLQFKTNGYLITASTLTLGGPSITVDTGVTATISSVVAGSAGLSKFGSGTLKLTNANGYAGGTAISGGKLIVLNSTGSGTGTGAVVVEAAGTLGGTGTIQGGVTNSGTITPGDAVGTLHIGGTYSQAAGGRLEIELASVASHDELAVTGAASLAGTLAVSLTGGFMPQAGNAFEIVSTSGFGGTTFSNTNLPTLPANLVWFANYGANSLTLQVTLAGDFDHNGAVNAADYVWWRKFDGTLAAYDTWRSNFGQAIPSGAAAAASVPEPATCLLLLGVGMAVVWASNRRSRGSKL